MAYHACIYNSQGEMKCWGHNYSGELGLGDVNHRGDELNEMGLDLPFVKIGNGLKVNQIATGGAHTCVLLTNNQLKCWGFNLYGQLGLGIDNGTVGDTPETTPDKLAYINFGALSSPAKIVCGRVHTCVLFANKQIKCFGSNQLGQIGFEGITTNVGKNATEMGDALPFVKLGTGVEVQSIYTSASADHSCIIIATSQLIKCWGNNQYRQLGTFDSTPIDTIPYDDPNVVGQASGTMGDKLPSIALGSVKTVKVIGIGSSFTCALRTDDLLKCWGSNTHGQLSIGAKVPFVYRTDISLSTPIDAGKKIKQISAGMDHNCILFDDNITVKCVGGNSAANLGQGDTTDRGDSPSTIFPNIPAINLGTGSLQISYINALNYATCVVFVDSSVKCFGSGSEGEMGNGKKINLGDDPSEMGSNLTFITLFPSTASPTSTTKTPTTGNPTKAPAILCLAVTKKECKQNKSCVWKKKKCSFVDCLSFTAKKTCKANVQCAWKNNTCSFK